MDQGIGQQSNALPESHKPSKRKSRNRCKVIALIAIGGIALTVWMNRGPSDPDAIAIQPPIIAPGSSSETTEPNPLADLANLKKLTGPNAANSVSSALDEFVAGEPGLSSSANAGPILIPTRDIHGTQIRQAHFEPMRSVRPSPRGQSQPARTSQAAWLTGTIEPVNDGVSGNSSSSIQIQ